MRTTDDQGTRNRDQAAPDLLTISPHWVVWPLDQQAHAVDPWADHPRDIWIARFRYRLPSSTGLHDKPPGGSVRVVSGESRESGGDRGE